MGKKLTIIVIAAAVLIIMAAAGFIAFKFIKRNRVDEANVTLFKCHMGKEITDSDLDEIKEAIQGALGYNVLEIKKGSIPYIQNPTNREGEETYVGDSITLTLSVITDDDKVKLFELLAEKYNITLDYLIEGMGYDIYRPDYKNK